MRKLILPIFIACSLCAACTKSSQVPLLQWDGDYVVQDECLQLMGEFLDLYEDELLSMYDLFVNSETEFEDFQMMEYADGRPRAFFLEGNSVPSGNLDFDSELRKFCRAFRCTYVHVTRNEPPVMYLQLAFAETKNHDLIISTFLYGKGVEENGINVFAIPEHEHWFDYVTWDL